MRATRRWSGVLMVGAFVGLLGLVPGPDSAGAAEGDEGEERLPRRPLAPVTEPREPLLPQEMPDGRGFVPLPDRWTIAPPPYELNVKGHWWDPYNQNLLKGDRPMWGQDTFLNLTLASETLAEYRAVPTPGGVSAERAGSAALFGAREQGAFSQNLIVSADLFKGDTAFRPFDWRVKGTVIANLNFFDVRERGIVNVDVREGVNRRDGFFALQEFFVEAKYKDRSPNYDFVSVRAGLQPFSSDFRGFVFTDTNLGVRLFGNAESNRDQYNLAFFDQREKETNSGLNRFERRGQEVFVGNVYRQDFLVPGYTAQVSAHYLLDEESLHFDENGFLARPDAVGVFKPHEIRAAYYGWAGSGHAGRVNVEHAAYYVVGEDRRNPIAGREVDIRAGMAALEVSYDHDWFRPKVSYFYASGDGNPTDDTARGFDAIFDNPAFAGGPFSFWNRLGLRLAGTGVALVNRGSVLPDLRSSKEEGQPNFVNPGIHLVSAGVDVDVTPKLKGVLNANYLRFDQTEALEFLLFQAPIHKDIGWDLGAGLRYRPLLSNNIVILAGVAAFIPGEGFKDIYESGRVLQMAFTTATLVF
ncbi:MAG: hypothetical protein HY207_11725 [Nitrospirae bacterium]|nr:hypothetical protein [Nitrospirota bacterium]